jgi:hypothetical protein
LCIASTPFSRLAGHDQVRAVGQNLAQARTHDCVVVGNQNADAAHRENSSTVLRHAGTRSNRRVPPCSRLLASNRPFRWSDPLAYAAQAERLGLVQVFRRQAASVVADFQHDVVVFLRQPDFDLVRVRSAWIHWSALPGTRGTVRSRFLRPGSMS